MMERMSDDDYLDIDELNKIRYKTLKSAIQKLDPDGELFEFKIYTHDGKDVTDTLYK